MSELVVELYGRQVGTLTGEGASFDFVAHPEAIQEFGLDRTLLSLAVPLAVIAARARRPRRQNFFAELLPEGRMRARLSEEAGVAERDVMGMLRAYGRDVAGALQIWDPAAPGEPRAPALEPLGEVGVAELLRNVSAFPLANKPRGGKTSLAGVQDKIVLVRTSAGWARALDGFPSTHILKPASREYPTLIYDEEYGARFARALALSTFDRRIQEFDGTSALVIERYDRQPVAGSEEPRRIHQEDFNQVLGARGDEKYQRYGGKVSLARVARELSMLGDRESLVRLARLIVLSSALGNLDMHTKNLSLLHSRDGSVTLAPAYDVVPQVHLPNDGELALAVDGVYRHAALTRDNLISELASWGLREATEVVDTTLTKVLDTLSEERPHSRAHTTLATDIHRFTSNLLAGRAAGQDRER